MYIYIFLHCIKKPLYNTDRNTEIKDKTIQPSTHFTFFSFLKIITSYLYINATSITTSMLYIFCNIWIYNLVLYFVIATLFTVIPPVTIVTIKMFTPSMTTLNILEYMWIHILILNTLKIMCTKNLCHIFMLTYFTSLSFWSVDAVNRKLTALVMWHFIFSILAGKCTKNNTR